MVMFLKRRNCQSQYYPHYTKMWKDHFALIRCIILQCVLRSKGNKNLYKFWKPSENSPQLGRQNLGVL